MGGPVLAPQGARPGAPSAPGPFGDAGDNANTLLNPGLDPTEQDASAYGYPPMVGQGHNGAGGESY